MPKYVVHLSPVKYGDGKTVRVFMPGDVVSIPEEVASVHPEIFKPFVEPEEKPEEEGTLEQETEEKPEPKSKRRKTRVGVEDGL